MKKCWSCFSVSFFYLLKKEKNLSIPLGYYSLSNPKRELLALLASLANLSITIAIKLLGFDLEELAFLPFARNDPQRNFPSPPQHEKWKAFRRLPQNDDLSKFQKWKWSRITFWANSKSGNGAKWRFEQIPKVEMEQNDDLSDFQKWKWSKTTIWANSKSGLHLCNQNASKNLDFSTKKAKSKSAFYLLNDKHGSSISRRDGNQLSFRVICVSNCDDGHRLHHHRLPSEKIKNSERDQAIFLRNHDACWSFFRFSRSASRDRG